MTRDRLALGTISELLVTYSKQEIDIKTLIEKIKATLHKCEKEEPYWHTGEPTDNYGQYVVRVSDGEFSFYVIDIFENGFWLNQKKRLCCSMAQDTRL